MAKLYGEGVAWIARNDEPSEMSESAVSESTAARLLAELFNVDPDRVAADVIRYRRGGAEAEARRVQQANHGLGGHLPSVEAALAVLLPERS